MACTLKQVKRWVKSCVNINVDGLYFNYLRHKNDSCNIMSICTPEQNILIRSGLFHTYFTPETCLRCMQTTNFTYGTRLNMPERKFTPMSWIKNFTLDSGLQFFTPVYMWLFELDSHDTTLWVDQPQLLSKTHFNRLHPLKKFDCLMKEDLHVLILKHAMDMCYIFLSSIEYSKKR